MSSHWTSLNISSRSFASQQHSPSAVAVSRMSSLATRARQSVAEIPQQQRSLSAVQQQELRMMQHRRLAYASSASEEEDEDCDNNISSISRLQPPCAVHINLEDLSTRSADQRLQGQRPQKSHDVSAPLPEPRSSALRDHHRRLKLDYIRRCKDPSGIGAAVSTHRIETPSSTLSVPTVMTFPTDDERPPHLEALAARVAHLESLWDNIDRSRQSHF
eukprot:PhM_4_TR9082/c0_g1_i1/m.92484